MLLHICSKIMKVSLTVLSFRTDTNFILNIPKENNSEKKNGGVMVLVLCILSNEALYLFQVSMTVLKLQSGYDFETNNFKGALFCKKT